MDLFDLKEEFITETFDEKNVPAIPIMLFKLWFGEAAAVKVFEPNAAILATVNSNGMPSARVLLIKSFSEDGFTFFTNYESKKGRQLEKNKNAAMVFHWPDLERQVRIEGIVKKMSPKDSDRYFETRPTGSRLGAWASPQSDIIEGRAWLEAKHNEFRQQFKKGEIPRPVNWGGYLLRPNLMEFWQGRQNRLHDRLEYFREEDKWKIRRLAP